MPHVVGRGATGEFTQTGGVHEVTASLLLAADAPPVAAASHATPESRATLDASAQATGGITFTYGGLHVDADGAVLRRVHGLERLGRIHEIFEIAAEHAGLLDRVEHALGLARVAPEGLGHEHGLARLQAEQSVRFVERVRRCHIDRVHTWIGEHLRIAAV